MISSIFVGSKVPRPQVRGTIRQRSLNALQMNSTRMPFDHERFHFGKAWAPQMFYVPQKWEGWDELMLPAGARGETKITMVAGMINANSFLLASEIVEG